MFHFVYLPGLDEVLVDEEGLHGVAGGRVVALGVGDDLERLLGVGAAVDVDVADALGVAQHGDHLALLLDRAHQVRGAARDDQVDVLRGEREEVASGNKQAWAKIIFPGSVKMRRKKIAFSSK